VGLAFFGGVTRVFLGMLGNKLVAAELRPRYKPRGQAIAHPLA